MKGLLWFIWFACIVGLSTWFLFGFEGNDIGWLGLPEWLFGFFILEVILVLSIALFVKFYWKPPTDKP